MSDLILRLEAMGSAAAPGDWADVVERAELRRRRTLRKRLIIAVAAALLAVPAIAVATGHWNVFSLAATNEDVPLPDGETKLGYVVGNELRLPSRPPAMLARPIGAYFPSQFPLVVRSPDGRSVVYHTWVYEFDPRRRTIRTATNFLRVHDLRTGRDRLLERGAAGIAWRRDGALAYVRSTVPEFRNTLRGWRGGRFGHIYVREAPDSPPARWTTAEAEWIPLAWAGDQLLAQSMLRRVARAGVDERLPRGVWAFSGPGRGRPLPIDTHIAVSPDGRFVIGVGGSGTPYSLRVVEPATGRVVVSVPEDELPGVEKDEVDRNLLGNLREGSWEGDTIIAGGGIGHELGGPIDASRPETLRWEGLAGLTVFRFSDGRLSVERTLKLTGAVAEATGLRHRYSSFEFVRPLFVDGSARWFTSDLRVIPASGRAEYVFVTCDIEDERCRRGRVRRPLEHSAELVYNPSRPLPD